MLRWWVLGLALLGILTAAPKINRPKDCFPNKEPDCKIFKIAQSLGQAAERLRV